MHYRHPTDQPGLKFMVLHHTNKPWNDTHTHRTNSGTERFNWLGPNDTQGNWPTPTSWVGSGNTLTILDSIHHWSPDDWQNMAENSFFSHTFAGWSASTDSPLSPQFPFTEKELCLSVCLSVCVLSLWKPHKKAFEEPYHGNVKHDTELVPKQFWTEVADFNIIYNVESPVLLSFVSCLMSDGWVCSGWGRGSGINLDQTPMLTQSYPCGLLLTLLDRGVQFQLHLDKLLSFFYLSQLVIPDMAWQLNYRLAVRSAVSGRRMTLNNTGSQ